MGASSCYFGQIRGSGGKIRDKEKGDIRGVVPTIWRVAFHKRIQPFAEWLFMKA